MAKSLIMPGSDTSIPNPQPQQVLTPRAWNYKADWRVTDNAKSEVRITNLTTAIDEPMRLRFAQNSIKDIYKGTDIAPNLYYPVRSGTQILSQYQAVWVVTDSTDPSYLAYLPVEAHMVVRIPTNDLIAESNVLGLMECALGGFFDRAASGRLKAMLRGALLPPSL